MVVNVSNKTNLKRSISIGRRRASHWVVTADPIAAVVQTGVTGALLMKLLLPAGNSGPRIACGVIQW